VRTHTGAGWRRLARRRTRPPSTADPADIAATRLLADEAAVRGAGDCLQVHGGVGFTWESDVHLHIERAWVRTQRAEGATESEEALAADLLTGTA
jgi:alkylation response protein AidB-like acyl-CoA dehydrogenase